MRLGNRAGSTSGGLNIGRDQYRAGPAANDHFPCSGWRSLWYNRAGPTVTTPLTGGTTVRYMQRVVLGLVIILASFVVLWFGSPDRIGNVETASTFGLAYVILFAIGFIVASMGLLGAADDYPALLSGLVLYFIVGAVIAIVIYFGQGAGFGATSLEDAGTSGFWFYWLRVAATWPLELVQRAGLFGYESF